MNESSYEKNIEAMKKERERLREQNGKDYVAYQEVIGGDVYDRHGTYNNTARIKELNQKIKDSEEAYERHIQAQGEMARAKMESERAAEEKARQEEFEATAKYSYEAGGKVYKTNDRALAARYDAQHRFFGMSKTKQAIAKITGQYRKFSKLWNMTGNLSAEQQEIVADKLDSMFRR